MNCGYLAVTWSTYGTWKRIDEDWPAVAESLEGIGTALLAWKDAIVNLTADDRTLIRAESHVATLLETLPEHSSGLVSWDQQLPLINEGLVIRTQVNIFNHVICQAM